MRTFRFPYLVALGVATALGWLHAQPAVEPTPLAELAQLFDAPPDDARVMMRWWWFGPQVTADGLDRDLAAMKAAGLGGVEVQPVYPLALDGDDPPTRTRPFLSPAFLDVLTHARATANDLGLRFDITLGSGWPFGGPSVAASDAAGALRIEKVPVASGARTIGLPMIGAGETLLAVYLTAGDARPAGPEAFRPVPVAESARGQLPLAAPAASPHTAWVFIGSRTGMMVKRPAIGGEGFVLDHYDRGALDRYLAAVGTPLLKALAASRPYAVFCDSLEVFGSDWTPRLLDAFQRRYGYDLRAHLPELVAGDDAASRGVRHDWGQLLTERLESEFLGPLAQWAHERDTRLRVQTYGIPPARPSSAGLVDLPEGEGAQWRTVTSVRWASSAAHVFGRPVTSSETWTWLHSPSFAATPLDIKVEADRHFLQGVTQLIGHGWPNTPAGVEWPGARFYAAAVLSDANPWWIVMPDLARYLQRSSAMLRQGTAVNDVALYLPVSDAWSRMQPGNVHLFEMLRDHVGTTLVSSLLDAGFTFDVVDDPRLQTDARIDGRELVIGKARYKAVVVPNAEIVPAQTMDLLVAFARAGGTVVATRRLPSQAPGFGATAEQHAHVAKAAASLFGGSLPGGVLVEQDSDAGARLAARVTPDVRWGNDAAALGFVHRRVGDRDVYFVANTSNRPVAAQATFRSSGSPQRWDPMSGDRMPAWSSASGDSRTVDVALAPYGAVFYVFGSSTAGPTPATRTAVAQVEACEPRAGEVDLAQGWRLAAPGTQSRTLQALTSWHEQPDLRTFSGVATYRLDVDVPQAVLAAPCGAWLDFGEGTPHAEERLTNGMRAWLDAPIRDGARVIVNGQDIGAVWAPPYRIRVGQALRKGANVIEARVGNTALNAWSARPQPDYRLLHLRYGKRFDPQDLDKVVPLPSGLIGRPRLLY
ncbi:glycosyl hydrolase [Luteitalea pratensis]|nr:glycosyl hydrolase [Luteitalea pratensis]